MSTYKIEVQIDPYWVEQYTSDQIQFCYSFGVEDSSAPGKEPHFNIVSGAVFPLETQSISWNDKILIAATEIMDLSSSQQSTSSQVPISALQRVILPSDAIEFTSPQSDSSLPSDSASFVFENQRPASAILFREVNGQSVAFYVSAEGPNGAGESILTPKGVCRLFFGPRVAVGSLSGGSYISETVDVEVGVGGGKSQVRAIFGREGKWSIE